MSTTRAAHVDLSVPEAIVRTLDEAGVPFVLGLPGGYLGPIMEALHGHPRIRTIQVREESIATMMAEAYGRLRGRPLVVVGQGAWIASNAGQGLLEARLGSSPLVVLTDMTESGTLSHHAPYQSGSGDYGSWDAERAFAAFSKRVMVAGYPGQVVQQLQLAFKHATTGSPGPVTVLLRGAALRGSVSSTGRLPLHHTAGYLDSGAPIAAEQSLAAVASAVAAAERPVILAGNGVRVGGACAELIGLAERWDVPVATTSGGKGVIPEAHPLAVGTVGTYGHAAANSLVARADVVVAVGTRIGPNDTLNETLLSPGTQLIAHIDVEPLHVGWTTPTDIGVIGDAADALGRLCHLVGRSSLRTAAADRVATAQAASPPTRHETNAAAAPFAAPQVIDALQAVWPSDAIACCDAGENRLFMQQWFRPTVPGGYLQPAGSGCMGYAVPAALGARLAHPERPAVAVLGDGGFAMSLHALMTAVQERIGIGVVVLDNQALGWVLHAMGDRAVAAALGGFDHAAIARAMGCEAVRPQTTDELHDALARCVGARDVPFVVDVPITLVSNFNDLAAPDPRAG